MKFLRPGFVAFTLALSSGCVSFQQACGPIQGPAVYRIAETTNAQSGTLEVRVIDQAGLPQVGTNVVFWRKSGFVLLCASNLDGKTGPQGIARFENVTPARYTVGFSGSIPPYTYEDVTVWATKTAHVTLVAKPVPGQTFTEGGGRPEGP